MLKLIFNTPYSDQSKQLGFKKGTWSTIITKGHLIDYNNKRLISIAVQRCPTYVGRTLRPLTHLLLYTDWNKYYKCTYIRSKFLLGGGRGEGGKGSGRKECFQNNLKGGLSKGKNCSLGEEIWRVSSPLSLTKILIVHQRVLWSY